MYVVSITAQDYFVAAQLTTIQTTKNEADAPTFSNEDAKETLKTLRRLGYEPLLIKVPQANFVLNA